MEISSRYYHIDVGTAYQGIFKYSIIREFEEFKIQIELYRLTTNDSNVVDLVRKYCQNTSTRINILNKIDNKLTDSIKLDFIEVENYYQEVKNSLSQITKSVQDYNKIYNFNISGKIKIPLTFYQFKRFYFDIKSFYENYFLLETVLKMIVNQENFNINTNKKEKIVDKAYEYKQQQDEINNTLSENINGKNNFNFSDNKQEISDEQNRFFNIFEFSFNPLITTSLIHLYISYYQYIDENHCNIENTEENRKIINIPSIFPNSYVFNDNYFKSIILSLSKYSLDDISYFSNKIVSFFKNEEFNQDFRHLLMASYLFFIYCLRYVYETHTQQFFNRFEEIVSNAESQQRIINHFITNYYKTNSITFKVTDIDINYYKEQDELIKELSNKYSYMINISQEEFIKNILGEINKDNQKNKSTNQIFPQIKELELFDLDQLLINSNERERKKNKLVSNNLIDSENTIDFDELDYLKGDYYLLDLFNYRTDLSSKNSSNTVITYPYKRLIEYINNPDTVFVNRDKIPEQLRKSFDILKELLTNQNFRKENVKTISYYKIVYDNLPDPSIFPHTFILYIIYQIIIPYYYDFYGITKFEDCLI